MYRLTLFGGLSLQGPSGPLTGRIVQRSQLALLALLSRESAPPVTRERVVGLLWSDQPEDRARARLSDVLYVIRKELGEDAVLSVGDALSLNAERIASDAGAFEDAADAARWEEAVELYAGPFLDGFHVNNGVSFERWIETERRRLAGRYREGLETLAEAAEDEEDWSRAVLWWRRRAAEELTNSRVALRLMHALAAAGNAPGALEHARVHELLLQDELGVPLPREVRSLADELVNGEAARPGSPAMRPAVSQDEGDSGEQEELGPEPETTFAPQGRRRLEVGWRPRRSGLAAAGVTGLTVLIAGGAWISGALGAEDESWVVQTAIPEIEALTNQGLYDSAWTVARRAQAVTPTDPDLGRLLPQFTWLWPELHTDPAGARVLHRPYGTTDAPWEELGVTPLDTFRLPLGATALRIERDGHRPVYAVPDHYLEEFPVFTLDPPERLPEDMVRIPGLQGSIEGEPVELGDFFMGRYPVTNQEYLVFVESGGYRDPAYWEHPFVLAGDTLSWEGAMERFTDRTGRTGPSTWEVGRFPEGKGDHPVGGVSWYEAAAYARFVDRSLPSVHHWRRAYGSRFFGEHMIPESNLHSDGTTPVGAQAGMGPFGTFDMAGNVREWIHNGRGEERFILGAGWDDPEKLALSTSYTQPKFDRAPANGIRLVEYLEQGPELDRALAPQAPRPTPDFLEEAVPPTDEQFEIFQRMYAYDPAPLEARLETADTARHWVRETISFDAAYDGERMLLHLYLPRTGSPPFQTVVYWPGAGARTFRSVEQKTAVHTGFIVQSGRALAFPVLKGTLERRDAVNEISPPRESVRYRDLTIRRVQDLMRTVDYLESREEVDNERLAYLGWSWGGAMAPLVLSLEARLQAAVLHVGGLTDSRALPEADPLKYLARVQVPVLMMNGDRDTVYPLETHAMSFFQLLGTSPEHKRFVAAQSGHFVPRPQLIRESLDWLDRYLGAPDIH